MQKSQDQEICAVFDPVSMFRLLVEKPFQRTRCYLSSIGQTYRDDKEEDDANDDDDDGEEANNDDRKVLCAFNET